MRSMNSSSPKKARALLKCSPVSWDHNPSRVMWSQDLEPHSRLTWRLTLIQWSLRKARMGLSKTIRRKEKTQNQNLIFPTYAEKKMKEKCLKHCSKWQSNHQNFLWPKSKSNLCPKTLVNSPKTCYPLPNSPTCNFYCPNWGNNTFRKIHGWMKSEPKME